MCAQRVRWGLLVMRGVSLVGVSQAEVGFITVTDNAQATASLRNRMKSYAYHTYGTRSHV